MSGRISGRARMMGIQGHTVVNEATSFTRSTKSSSSKEHSTSNDNEAVALRRSSRPSVVKKRLDRESIETPTSNLSDSDDMADLQASIIDNGEHVTIVSKQYGPHVPRIDIVSPCPR